MRLISIIKQSDFLRHNAVFFVGSIAVGALNYLYYPVLGRLLPPASFGEIQVLISLFLQFTIFLNVLSMITVNITVNLTDKTKAHRIIFELEKLAVYAALGLVIISIIGGEFLRRQLQFDSQVPFTALALAILVSIPLTFRSSFARGQKRFGIATLSQLIGAGVKIAFSSGLVVAGLGVSGAIFGIVAAQLLAFLYAARWAARLGFSRGPDTHYGTLPNLRLVMPELRYGGSVLVGLLSVTLLVSVDVIVAKYYFDARTAGLYAGIATAARTVFFAATPVAQVLMPLVKIDQSNRQNYKLFMKSLLLTALVCIPLLLLCTLRPALVIRILMGVEYITYASLLPPLVWAVFVISIINLIFMYYLALRQKMVMLVGIIGLAATLGLIVMYHNSLQSIVSNMLVGSVFTLGTTGIYVLVNLKRGHRHANQNHLDRYPDL